MSFFSVSITQRSSVSFPINHQIMHAAWFFFHCQDAKSAAEKIVFKDSGAWNLGDFYSQLIPLSVSNSSWFSSGNPNVKRIASGIKK